MPHPPPSDAALTLLKHFEQGPNGGFAPVAYRCPAGHKTIGWGHRLQSGERFQQPISPAEAEHLLRRDLLTAGGWVDVSVGVLLTQSMMDALACFVFNVGYAAFRGSTLYAVLNAGQYEAAANEFLKWDKAKNPKTGRKERLTGLTRRRQAERELFLRDGLPG